VFSRVGACALSAALRQVSVLAWQAPLALWPLLAVITVAVLPRIQLLVAALGATTAEPALVVALTSPGDVRDRVRDAGRQCQSGARAGGPRRGRRGPGELGVADRAEHALGEWPGDRYLRRRRGK
jgi:hypothetical protein